MTNAQQTFKRLFDSIPSSTGFDPAWANGTGYLDGLVHDQSINGELAIGEIVKLTDDHGRRAIAVKTRYGMAVIFERYSPEGEERCGVIVSNVPWEVRPFLPEGAVSPDDMYRLLQPLNNLGHMVERVCGEGRSRVATVTVDGERYIVSRTAIDSSESSFTVRRVRVGGAAKFHKEFVAQGHWDNEEVVQMAKELANG